MILNYLGCHVDGNDIKKKHYTPSSSGWSFLDLKRASAAFGVSSEGARVVNPDYFQSVKEPIIVYWNFSHFVIFERVYEDKYTIMDPRFGRLVLSKQEFMSKFSGYVMYFNKNENFQAVKRSMNKEWSYLKEHFFDKKLLVQLLVFSLLSQFMLFTTPVMMQVMINNYTASGSVTPIITGFFLFVMCMYFFFYYINGNVKAKYQKQVDFKSTDYFVNKLFSMKYMSFQQRSTGDLTVRTFSNQAIRDLLLNNMVPTVVSILMMVGSFGYMFYIDPIIASVLISFCILLFVTNIFFMKKLNFLALMENYYLAEQRGKLNESLAEFHFIKANNIVGSFLNQWMRDYMKYLETVQDRMKLQSIIEALQNSLRNISLFAFLIIGFLFFLSDRQSIGNVVLFVSMSSLIFGPTIQISNSLLSITRSKPLLTRILDIVDGEMEDSNEGKEVVLKGNIEFENVSYQYRPNESVLQSVNIKIEAGENIAIVGKTGSGKTTILNLLLRIYDDYKGSIKLDSKELNQLQRESLRDQIGLITQDSVLFNGTLKENLDMFGAPVSEDILTAAVNKAQLQDDLKSWTRKVHVPIVEGGKNYSGGQKQRLAMIRVFLKNYPVLLLDEPTNHLDTDTASKLLDEIFKIKSTKIFITHDQKILSKMDKVYEIHEGILHQRKGVEKNVQKVIV